MADNNLTKGFIFLREVLLAPYLMLVQAALI